MKKTKNYFELLNEYIFEELKPIVNKLNDRTILFLSDNEKTIIIEKIINKIEREINYKNFINKITGAIIAKNQIIMGKDEISFNDMNYYFSFALYNYIKFVYKNFIIEMIQKGKIKNKDLIKKLLIEVIGSKTLSILKNDDETLNKELNKLNKLKLSYSFYPQLVMFINTERKKIKKNDDNVLYMDDNDLDYIKNK